jgi:hypothetical protein
MSHADETSGAAQRRLVERFREMETLMIGLLRPQARVDRDVRLIRKLGKSLRGGLTLLGLDSTAGREVQAIGRLLAGQRDAVSRLDTWRRLGWNGDSEVAAAIASLLSRQRGEAGQRPPPAAIAWALTRLRTARGMLAAEDRSPALLEKKLKNLHKQMVKRCRGMKNLHPDDFHEARKALKAWTGALAFLPQAPPEAAAIDKLGGILGRENDLAMLENWLERHGFTAKLAPGLWKTIRKRRCECQARAVQHAGKLFST